MAKRKANAPRVIHLGGGETVILKKDGRVVATDTTPDDLVGRLARYVALLEDTIEEMAQASVQDLRVIVEMVQKNNALQRELCQAQSQVSFYHAVAERN